MSLDIAAAYSNTRKLNKTILRQSLNQAPVNPISVTTKSVLANPLKSIGRKTLVSSIDMKVAGSGSTGQQNIQNQTKMMQTRNMSKKHGVTVHP